jgi:hypothetical protein
MSQRLTLDGLRINGDMPQDRYVAALERQRERIDAGLHFEMWDDETIGNKSTECSWGMCCEQPSLWPEPEDHIWPESFIRQGRVAPRRLADGQFCPFDRREKPKPDLENSPMGCFRRCMFFRPTTKRPDRARALQLYDEQLAKAKAEAP